MIVLSSCTETSFQEGVDFGQEERERRDQKRLFLSRIEHTKASSNGVFDQKNLYLSRYSFGESADGKIAALLTEHCSSKS